MNRLRDHDWAPRYDSDSETLLKRFFVPALACARRYDRSVGYFEASILTHAAHGVEGLVHNGGRMRLVVGCTLDRPEADAIEHGASLRATIGDRLSTRALTPFDEVEHDALQLLAWMVEHDYLEVKVAVPCDAERRPVPDSGLFHTKTGIVEDVEGDRIAFSGSANETASAWIYNWESFHVFRDWDGGRVHVEAEERNFDDLWCDRASRVRVVDVPTAVRDDLLRYQPPDGRPPRRLADYEPAYLPGGAGHGDDEEPAEDLPPPEVEADPAAAADAMPAETLRRLAWGLIQHGPALPGLGDRVGEATANVEPWPHQVNAFNRMYASWPPRLLIADEVGLGKTITVGLLLRQAWLSGRAPRILVLAPKSVLKQWQVELREKFNLNWPIYDGQRLTWGASPGAHNGSERPVARDEWHQEPCVITSSQLMRRDDRARELCEQAEPFDLVVLDEAHHARRSGAGGVSTTTPNKLLRLMQRLSEQDGGLLLLTATPMQVDPIEVYDLLALLGVPPEWSPERFKRFFECAAQENPSPEDFEFLARQFRAVEATWGEVPDEQAQRQAGLRRLGTRRVLNALRDDAVTSRRRLETPERRVALSLVQKHTIVSRLISRHTRELLRRYYREGRISTPIATRDPIDRFVSMTGDEAEAYEAVEDYIGTTYQQAAEQERGAVGFIMTVYRRRMASSFAALARTLERRLERFDQRQATLLAEDDLQEDELDADVLDTDDAAQLEAAALRIEERSDLERLLTLTRALPADTKAQTLVDEIQALRSDGYQQVMVFTQYTDTVDFLRDYLVEQTGLEVLCFSGRGGEVRSGGTWSTVSRDEVKAWFQDGRADIMLCTDAAGEGLNFQFCGALINYDMPWNPMKVEQRIGRIDRLGQRYETIRIRNMHYEDTVEADIYRALSNRIGLFNQFVGKLQPILSQLPNAIRDATLSGPEQRDRQRDALVSGLAGDIATAQAAPFDLELASEEELDVSERPRPVYDLDALDALLQRPHLLPPGVDVQPLGANEYRFSHPGMKPIRVTTSARYYEQHTESVELWSPGSPVFPHLDDAAPVDDVDALSTSLRDLLASDVG